MPARSCLPAAYCGIDITRVKLQTAADAARALGCDQGRAAAEEGVEHDLAAGRSPRPEQSRSASATSATGLLQGDQPSFGTIFKWLMTIVVVAPLAAFSI